MKKIISVMLCLALVVTLFGQTAFTVFAGGNPTITCTSKECYPGETVTVDATIANNPGIMYLSVTPTYASELGTPTITNGEVISAITTGKNLVWSPDESVDANGKLVSLKFTVGENVTPGDYSVGFIFRESYDSEEAPVTFTVVPATVHVKEKGVAVTGVSLNKSTATVAIDETVTLTPTLAPSNATNKNVTWTTSDSTVAAVSNGVVTGKKAGSATITVKTEDGSFTAACVVTVKSSQAAEDQVRVVVESTEILRGKTFTVDVSIENNQGFGGLILEPDFSDKLNLESVTNGELIDDLEIGTQYVWVANEDVTANGKLMTFTFSTAEDLEPGEYDVSFIVRECFNYEAEESVGVVVEKGVINVIDYIYGDANKDEKVNLQDVIRLKKYLANYDYTTKTSTVEIGAGADANGDGKVNLQDVIRLKKYLANYDYTTKTSTVVLGPQK